MSTISFSAGIRQRPSSRRCNASYPRGPAVCLRFFVLVLALVLGFMLFPRKIQRIEYEYRYAEYENEYEETEKRANKSPVITGGYAAVENPA